MFTNYSDEELEIDDIRDEKITCDECEVEVPAGDRYFIIPEIKRTLCECCMFRLYSNY